MSGDIPHACRAVTPAHDRDLVVDGVVAGQAAFGSSVMGALRDEQTAKGR